MYYFYGKSNRGHGICPLYRSCPLFGESVIRGFTVYAYTLAQFLIDEFLKKFLKLSRITIKLCELECKIGS